MLLITRTTESFASPLIKLVTWLRCIFEDGLTQKIIFRVFSRYSLENCDRREGRREFAFFVADYFLSSSLSTHNQPWTVSRGCDKIFISQRFVIIIISGNMWCETRPVWERERRTAAKIPSSGAFFFSCFHFEDTLSYHPTRRFAHDFFPECIPREQFQLWYSR